MVTGRDTARVMAVAIATAAAGTFDAGEQHRELVAAEAGDRVTGAQHPAQPDRDLHQHRVAGSVPERVVHLLETVEVDQQHADPWVSRQRGLDVNLEQPPVRQAGERVVHRQMLVLGDVTPKVVDEATALDRHRDVVGHREERTSIGLAERPHRAAAVSDDERAPHLPVEGEGRDHRLLDAECAKRTGRVGRRDDRRTVRRVGHVMQRRHFAVDRHRRGLDRRPIDAEGDLQQIALTPVDVEEGTLGVHELAHICQQPADDLVDRSGAGHPLREAVQVLELAQAVTQGGVHAVREQHHRHDHAEEQGGGRRGDQERDRHQRHAGVDGDSRCPQQLRAQQPGLTATEEDRDGDGHHDALAGVGGERGERTRRAMSPGRSRASGTPRTP